MTYLPKECVYRIFSFLDDDDLDITKRVSRGLYQVSSAMRNHFDLRTERKDIFQREVVIGRTENMQIAMDRFKGEPDPRHYPITGFPKRYVSKVYITGATDDIYKCDLTYTRSFEVEPFVYKSVSLAGIDVILRHCALLETLIIPRVRLNNDAVRALKGAANLKRLSIMDAKVDPIDKVEFPVSLTDLDSSYCRYDKHNIPNLVNLKRLNVMDMILSPDEVERLFFLTKLECLDISWNMPGNFMRRIGNLGNLECFSSAMMGNLSRDGQLSYLNSLSNLKRLDLENCDVRSEHIAWMRDAQSIVHVNLSYNYIDSAGLEHLCANSQYETIDLSYNQVCDRGAEVVAASHMPRLKHLDLTCNYITASGATLLADLGGIQCLDMTRNMISSEAAREILETSRIPDLCVGMQRTSV